MGASRSPVGGVDSVIARSSSRSDASALRSKHVLELLGDTDRFELLHGGDALPTDGAQGVAEAVARAMNQGWRTEGEIMQKIADVHEAHGAGREEVALLESDLRRLGELATVAADELRTHLREQRPTQT